MTTQQLKELKAKYTKQQIFRMYWRQCLSDVEHLLIQKGLMKEFFPKQRLFLNGSINDNDEFRTVTIIRAGRRTSKTSSVGVKLYTLLYFGGLFDYEIQGIIGGPKAEDTKHLWRYINILLKECPLSDVFPDLEILYNNYASESIHKKRLRFKNDSHIWTGSGDDPKMDDFCGEGVDFIDADEFGSFKYKEQFLNVATHSLKDQNRLNLLDIFGTPDRQGQGKEYDALFKLGQEGSPNVISYHLKGSDNPYISERGAETAKEIVSEDAHRREELGEAVPEHGALFNNFNSKTQIKKLIFNPSRPLMGMMDFGFNKPYFAFWQYFQDLKHELLKYRLGVVRVLKELTPKQIRIPQFIPKIQASMLADFQNVGFSFIGCDPAGDHENDVINYKAFGLLKEDFPTARYTHRPSLKSKANQVILLDALMIQDRLEVDESCEELIRAIMMATPDMNQMGAINSPGWKKVKGLDDPLDGVAMGLINFAPTAEMINPIVKSEPLTEKGAVELMSLMSA